MFEDLSVVIPWRAGSDEWRLRSFDWILSRYGHLFSEAEIIVSDDGSEDFRRGCSRNKGVSEASRKFVLVADADTIPFPEFVAEGLRMLKRGAPWVIPYGDADYYNSDEKSARKILGLDPWKGLSPHDITWEHKLKSWAGQLLLRTDDYEAVDGYDPRFTGWGYEDNAFTATCDTLLGDHVRVDNGYTIHIWHPAPVSSTWEQPDIEMNRALYAQYDLARGNFDKMMQLVRGVE